MGLNGFIKIHRQIMEWGWYGDPNTKAVFLHLLLTANFKPGEYKGVPLKPGDAVFGRKSLAKQLGISEQNVRTAINRLKSTNEITIKSTGKFSVATIANWALYQPDDSKPTNEPTNTSTSDQPATNQQLTSNQPHLKKDKKDKKEKNDYYSFKEMTDEYHRNYFNMTLEERREFLRKQSELALQGENDGT